jgi:putative peptide zinc metalloprotease protein
MANGVNRTWPALREDLTLYPGPVASSGAPSWSLHDPARNQYFFIDLVTFEVISRIQLGSMEAVIQAMNEETTLSIDELAIQSVLTFLDENELIQRHDDVENYLIRQLRLEKE